MNTLDPAGTWPTNLEAYELYLQRGAGGGSAEDDWLRARRELES